MLLSYVITILIGVAGALIGYVMGLPAGALVGSMLAVGLVNVFGAVEIPRFPSEARFFLQLGLGLMLGSKLTIDTLYAAKELWRPALLCALIAIATGVLSGLLISHVLGVEPITAFFGTAPGGLSDMTLIALDMGAKANLVVVMHLIRLISVIVVVPWFIKIVVQPHSG
ncbi:MAG: AbrB family transcriptional regulator [Prochloraceae cyanobacterium]|nr:AbrB family transcriptional regulator [Prochloraceae cyanobacterium]